jgi:hypothetical protein
MLVERAPTVAVVLAADIAAAPALAADTAVVVMPVAGSAAVVMLAVVAAMVVAAADTGKFSGFNQKGPSASADGPFVCARKPARRSDGT